MKKVIICHNMKVFYYDGECISQRDISDIQNQDIDSVLCIEKFGSGYGIQTLSGCLGWLDLTRIGFGRSIPEGLMTAVPMAQDKFALSFKDRFLRANHLGSLDCVVDNASLWETFRGLEIDRFRDLVHICRNEWILDHDAQASKVACQHSTFDTISFGNRRVDFDRFLDDYRNYVTEKSFVFFDAWMPVKAVLLKPVIVLVVFGNGIILDQYKACVSSISILAKYRGDILIISDVQKERLINLAPKEIRTSIKVIKMNAVDTLDFVGARLSIFNSDFLDSYQPIIYSDVDIVFDTPIEDFLVHGARHEKCSAQIEEFHRIDSSDHSGAQLVRQDRFSNEAFQGFNGGLLLIPNMDKHGAYMRAAYTCIVDYTTQHGRNAIAFYDQSVLNYVLYKMDDFDGCLVSACTQIGGDEHSVREAPLDPANPRGFVHFWNARQRAEVMEHYIDAVIQAGRAEGSNPTLEKHLISTDMTRWHVSWAE